MATGQLDISTPKGADGMTVCLSEKTRVVAHSAFQYKSGYMTLAKYNDSTTKWRSVHIAKKSCSILMEESSSLLNSLDSMKCKQVKLTRRQFVMVTKFRKTGDGEDIFYITLLHPFTETDVVESPKDCNHAKTINLNKQEFTKLAESLPKLIEKMGTPREQKHEVDESDSMRVYRWYMPVSGMNSVGLFVTPDLCKRSVMCHLNSIVTEGVPAEDNFNHNYKIVPVDMARPCKFKVVEHIYYTLLLEKTGIPTADLMLQTPSMEVLQKADASLTRSEIVEASTSVAAKLGNKRLYLVPEAYDLFAFISGKEKVMYYIVKNGISCSKMHYARLIDSCYSLVCKQDVDSSCHFDTETPLHLDEIESQMSDC